MHNVHQLTPPALNAPRPYPALRSQIAHPADVEMTFSLLSGLLRSSALRSSLPDGRIQGAIPVPQRLPVRRKLLTLRTDLLHARSSKAAAALPHLCLLPRLPEIHTLCQELGREAGLGGIRGFSRLELGLFQNTCVF